MKHAKNPPLVTAEEWAKRRHVSFHCAIKLLLQRGATAWDVYSTTPEPTLEDAMRRLDKEIDEEPEVELHFSPRAFGPVPPQGIGENDSRIIEHFTDVECALARVRELYGKPGFYDPTIYWRRMYIPGKTIGDFRFSEMLWDNGSLEEFVASAAPGPA